MAEVREAVADTRLALRPFVAAMVIDAVGSGVYLPFAILFFVSAHHIPVGVVGGAMAGANAIVIVLSGLVGVVVDRFHPRRVLVCANVLRAVVFACYVVAATPLAAVAVLVATSVLDKFCWVAQASWTGRLSSGTDARRVFSTVGWARNVGIGVGSAVGGVGASLWGVAGLYGVVLVNAASYVVAAVILARFEAPDVGGRPRDTGPAAGGYRAVLADRPFLVLAGAKLCFVLSAIAVANFLPFYLVGSAGLPTWTAGLVLTLNCVLVVLFQQHVTRWSAHVSRPRLLTLGGATYAVGGVLFLLSGQFALAAAIGCACVGMVVYTAGEIVIAPSSDSLAADLAPRERLGRYMSVYQLSWSVGSVLVPAAGAALLSTAPGWFWLLVVALAVLGSIAGAVLERGNGRK